MTQISFEFFPPTDERMELLFGQTVQRLAPLAPRFVSVTHGAGGFTRTQEMVQRLQSETSLAVAPHLTCLGASKKEVLDIARRYWDQGIRQLIALRGDAPQEVSRKASSSEGFASAADLVAGLRSIGNFEIAVAAYPETHPLATNADTDLDNLRRKLDAGATCAITQFFFDIEAFLRFRDRYARAGLNAPLIPGILPIGRFAQMRRFAERCATRIPAWLETRFSGLKEDDETTHKLIAASVAIEQVKNLERHGVHQFHFYTLNRAELVYTICHSLGIRTRSQENPSREHEHL